MRKALADTMKCLRTSWIPSSRTSDVHEVRGVVIPVATCRAKTWITATFGSISEPRRTEFAASRFGCSQESLTPRDEKDQKRMGHLRTFKNAVPTRELISVLWVTVISVSVTLAGNPSALTEKPNVLFIAVDDLRVELGCYGNTHVLSPNIDRLAQSGTVFERAYCQQTVCNPSRASLLTGLRPDTLRVWDLPTHFRQHKPDAVTLPELFKKHGYHAQGVGKIFHNWRQDDWQGDPVSWSVPAVLHYNSHGNDKPSVADVLPPNLASGKDGIECRDVPDDAYFDGRVAETAINALNEISRRGQPFFLAVGFWKPHTPFNAPKKYWDLYDRPTIPLPSHVVRPEGLPEIALTGSYYRGGADSQELREMHHGHLSAISYLDQQVGKVLARLDLLGLREKTIVVFWSDHGLHIGEHGLTGKTTAFELDAHVPLIFSTPMHKAGQRTQALVELLDVYPTLTDLCGLDAPSGLEGVSLRPLLEDPKTVVKRVALTQTPRPNYPRGELPEVMGYSIRTERYRYTQWQDFESGQVQARELYDHQQDPSELINLALAEERQDDVRRLEQILEETVGKSQESELHR